MRYKRLTLNSFKRKKTDNLLTNNELALFLNKRKNKLTKQPNRILNLLFNSVYFYSLIQTLAAIFYIELKTR